MKKQNGITLIALVITVIVVLILAGITINLSIGEDGIIKRAEQAGKNYQQAANDEKTELAEFTNLTDRLIDNVTKNHYTIVEGVPVPKGFTHIAGTKNSGFVIKNDTDGNEFVWVPCTLDGASGSIKYDRYVFLEGQPASGTDDVTSSIKIKYSTSENYVFTETMPSDEKTSIRTYGGYYIGRYETGIIGYKSVEINEDNTQYEYTGYTGGNAVIKSGQQVWNYITRDKAKKVSEDLYKKTNGASVNSKLCSSYAWDTALKFIEMKNPGYATSSDGGNYNDTTFSYIDLNDVNQTKVENKSVVVPTGQTQAVNNIYDMGGNTWEWTTEYYSHEGYCSFRGGACTMIHNTSPAAYRGWYARSEVHNTISFRITLYL